VFAALSADQQHFVVLSLSSDAIGGVTAAQIAAMPDDILSSMTPDSATKLLSSLSEAALTAFSPEQVSDIPTSVFAAMDAGTFDNLLTSLSVYAVVGISSDQLHVLPPEVFASLSLAYLEGLTPAQTGGITDAQIAALNPEQLTALGNDYLQVEAGVDEPGSAGVSGDLLVSGDAVTVLSPAGAAGVVSIDTGSGQWNFTLDPGQSDRFVAGEIETQVYTILVDTGGQVSEQKVFVTITGTNDAPQIEVVDVVGAILEGTTLQDNGSLTFTDVDLTDSPVARFAATSVAAMNGGAVLDLTTDQQAAIEAAFTINNEDGNANDGTVSWDYTITEGALDFLGAGETVTAIFTVTVTDDEDATATQDVTVTITGTNDAPTATVDTNATDPLVEQGFGVAGDSTATGNLLSNDSDPDTTDVLRVTKVDSGTGEAGSNMPADAPTEQIVLGKFGSLAVAATGVWTYSLNNADADTEALEDGETGIETFAYMISDGNGGTDTATLTLEIAGSGDNDAPVAVDDAITLDEDTPTTLDLVGNDTDANNVPVVTQTLFVASINGDAAVAGALITTSNGSITMGADGAVNYTPNDNFIGTDSFTYVTSDRLETSGSATAQLTIDPVNDVAVIGGVATGAVTEDSVAVTPSKLTAFDAAAVDRFGQNTSVSADGSTIVVAASLDDDDGTNSGSAYVFNRDGTLVTKLTAPDGAPNDIFGNSTSVSADGSTIVVGANADDDDGSASGSAYVFNRDGTLVTKLTAFDAAYHDRFGNSTSVSADGRTIVVGAYSDDDDGTNSGSAYVFNRDGTFVTKLTAPDGAPNDLFGYRSTSVSADGSTIVVGAFRDDDDGAESGSAYVFNRDGTLVIKLTAPDGAAGDEFGGSTSVSADGSTIVIGAYGDDEAGSHSGSAYVFNRDGTFVTKLTAFDAAANDWFGSTTVSADGNTIVVGAYQDDDAGSASGSAYVFQRNGDGNFVDAAGNIFGPTGIIGTQALGGGDTVSGALTIADVDAGEAALQEVPAGTLGDNGYGSFAMGTDGAWTFTLNNAAPAVQALAQGQIVTDTITVTSFDGSATQEIEVTITGTNDAPVAVSKASSGFEDTAINGQLVASDVDNDQADLTFALDTGPANGTVAVNADGSYRYTGNQDFNGTDSFTYQVSDGDGDVDTSTATITVDAVNDAPVAVAKASSGFEDTAIIGQLVASDVDNDQANLTFALDTGPSNGTVTLNADGSYRYTGNQDFNGTDSFTYQVNDGDGDVDTSTATITVDAVNDAPVTIDDNAFASSNGAVLIDVLVNDTDLDGDTLTITGVSGSTLGTVAIDGDRLVYEAGGTAGTDTFTYQVTDGVETRSAEVTVTVGLSDSTTVSTTIGDDVFLQGNFMEIGVSGAGSLGSMNPAPDGYHPNGSSRLSYVVDLDGWNAGSADSPPRSGDATIPGSPEDAIVVGYRSGGVPFVGTGAQQQRLDQLNVTTVDTSSDGSLSTTSTGSLGGVIAMQQVIELSPDATYYTTTVTLTNTSDDLVEDVRFTERVNNFETVAFGL
jgi:VCBS repeat-containing protein